MVFEVDKNYNSINRKVGLYGLISAAKAGCANVHEISLHLDVSEKYLQDALQLYRNHYGLGRAMDNYWIMFEPTLQVYELYELE